MATRGGTRMTCGIVLMEPLLNMLMAEKNGGKMENFIAQMGPPLSIIMGISFGIRMENFIVWMARLLSTRTVPKLGTLTASGWLKMNSTKEQ